MNKALNNVIPANPTYSPMTIRLCAKQLTMCLHPYRHTNYPSQPLALHRWDQADSSLCRIIRCHPMRLRAVQVAALVASIQTVKYRHLSQQEVSRPLCPYSTAPPCQTYCVKFIPNCHLCRQNHFHRIVPTAGIAYLHHNSPQMKEFIIPQTFMCSQTMALSHAAM
jgi:hypothetical protein